MSDEIQEGDKVRITYEGTVERKSDRYNRLHVRTFDDLHTVYLRNSKYSVEKLEPAYEHGAFYMDAHDEVFRYTNLNGDLPWRHLSGSIVVHKPSHWPVRPLRKLVPQES